MAGSEKIRSDLREKLTGLPRQPGVYIMKDAGSRILYIGKAKALRDRVRSYFQETVDGPPRQLAMISQIHDFEYIVTDNEVEALILEATLIRQHKPRYNVHLKDDKKFPYIKVTREPFPRILTTRLLEKDGADYFGPYTEATEMRNLLKTLRKVFPVRRCGPRLPGPEQGRSCLYAHIGQCLAPCLDEAGVQKEYGRLVSQINTFLSGHTSGLMVELEERMRLAAREQRFEEAARLRDQLRYIERFSIRQKVVSPRPIDRDVIAVADSAGRACGVILQIRDGKLMGRESYFLSGTEEKSKREVLTSFVKQHYLSAVFIPREICLQGEIEQPSHMADWLKGKRGGAVTLLVPRRGEKAAMIGMAGENAQLLLAEAAMREQQARERLSGPVAELQRVLGLRHPPRSIEAFDISTLSGTDAVGSMVSFRDGRSRRAEYRRYKIKSVSGQDDYAMMREVVGRRFRRLIDEEHPLPDLVLIDGGKGHLSAALEVMRALGAGDVDAIGLAKRLEEVYRPDCPAPQTIPKHSPALRLLQRIRDEAHRFAVEYHRLLRKKRTVRSDLENIPGIGEKRRTALLTHFGSTKRIREASVEEIRQVEGINPKLAGEVYEYLHEPRKKKVDE